MPKRYRAFISYSQKDKRHAKRLHSALESYRLPKNLAAPSTEPKTRGLGRFFRDDEEMGAATDLGETLRGAIANSESLIVICSPRSASSKWVNEEVLQFKRTDRASNIFAVIVDGAPNSGDPATECFPPALRFEVDPDGSLTNRPTEPLGLDLRKERFARIKTRLVAGLVGINFDDLWRRDRRR
ncbi:MAG: toll/interleukin-1 receptor domain-containing protein, partial [Pseudomonadota bacterium]